MDGTSDVTIESISRSDRCLRWAIRTNGENDYYRHASYDGDRDSLPSSRQRSTMGEEALQNRVSACTTLHWPSRMMVVTELSSPMKDDREALTAWQHASVLSLPQRAIATKQNAADLPMAPPEVLALVPLAERYGGTVSPAVRYQRGDKLSAESGPLDNGSLPSVSGFVSSPRITLRSPRLRWSLPALECDANAGGGGVCQNPAQLPHTAAGLVGRRCILPALGGYVLPISLHGESVRFVASPLDVVPPTRKSDDTTVSHPGMVGEPFGNVRFVNSAVHGTATIRSRFYEYAVRMSFWPTDGGNDDLAAVSWTTSSMPKKISAWTRRLYRLQLRLTSQVLAVTGKKRNGDASVVWDRVSTAALLVTLASDPRWSYSIAFASYGALLPVHEPLFGHVSPSVLSVGGAFDSGVQRTSTLRFRDGASPCRGNDSLQPPEAVPLAARYWRWRWTSVLGASQTSSMFDQRGVSSPGDIGLHSSHTAQLLAELPLHVIPGWLRLRLVGRATSSSSNDRSVVTKDNCVLVAQPTTTSRNRPHAAWSLQRYLVRNVGTELPLREGSDGFGAESADNDATSTPSAFLAGSCELQLPLRPFPTLDVCFFANGLVSLFPSHHLLQLRGDRSEDGGRCGGQRRTSPSLFFFLSWLPRRVSLPTTTGTTCAVGDGASSSGVVPGACDVLWSAGVSLVPKRRVGVLPSTSPSVSRTAATQFRWSKWNEKVGLRMECSWLVSSGYHRHRLSDGSVAAGQRSPAASTAAGGEERARWLPWRCGVVWDSDAATDDGIL